MTPHARLYSTRVSEAHWRLQTDCRQKTRERSNFNSYYVRITIRLSHVFPSLPTQAPWRLAISYHRYPRWPPQEEASQWAGIQHLQHTGDDGQHTDGRDIIDGHTTSVWFSCVSMEVQSCNNPSVRCTIQAWHGSPRHPYMTCQSALYCIICDQCQSQEPAYHEWWTIRWSYERTQQRRLSVSAMWRPQHAHDCKLHALTYPTCRHSPWNESTVNPPQLYRSHKDEPCLHGVLPSFCLGSVARPQLSTSTFTASRLPDSRLQHRKVYCISEADPPHLIISAYYSINWTAHEHAELQGSLPLTHDD